MSRLTEKAPSGYVKCGCEVCGYLRPCFECKQYGMNVRLYDYEDAIPYERLQEAAELLKRADYKRSKGNGYLVKVSRRR